MENILNGMNVLIVSAVFPPEPVVSAKISRDLALALSKSYQVTVLAPKPSRPFGFNFDVAQKDHNDDYPFKLVYINSFISPRSNFMTRFYESISFGLKCRQYIKGKKGKFDKIYMNSWPIFSQYFIVKIAKKFRIPIVTHIQDVYPEALKSKLPQSVYRVFHFFLIRIDKYIFRNSNKIIAISEGMKSELANSRGCDKSKINVVINWHDEEEFINFHRTHSLSLSNNSNNVKFMYLGNVGPIAGVDFIIEAFKNARLPSAELIIAGSGTERHNLEIMVSEQKIRNVFI